MKNVLRFLWSWWYAGGTMGTRSERIMELVFVVVGVVVCTIVYCNKKIRKDFF